VKKFSKGPVKVGGGGKGSGTGKGGQPPNAHFPEAVFLGACTKNDNKLRVWFCKTGRCFLPVGEKESGPARATLPRQGRGENDGTKKSKPKATQSLQNKKVQSVGKTSRPSQGARTKVGLVSNLGEPRSNDSVTLSGGKKD